MSYACSFPNAKNWLLCTVFRPRTNEHSNGGDNGHGEDGRAPGAADPLDAIRGIGPYALDACENHLAHDSSQAPISLHGD
jgi:hypothetical protein